MKINGDLTGLMKISCDLTLLLKINGDLTRFMKIDCDFTWLVTINCDLAGLTKINCDLAGHTMINCNLTWFVKISGVLAWLGIGSCDITGHCCVRNFAIKDAGGEWREVHRPYLWWQVCLNTNYRSITCLKKQLFLTILTRGQYICSVHFWVICEILSSLTFLPCFFFVLLQSE